jgi:ribose-phosphate pyrophosphokinase
VRYTEDVDGEDVVIVQTTSPPQDTHLIQLLLLINAAKDLGARYITAVVPYLAYSRQDKKFRPGEAVSLKTVIRLIEAAGANKFVTVDVHNVEALKEFKIPFVDLSAMYVLGEYAKSCGFGGAFSLAPDEFASSRAKVVDDVLGGGYGWLKKERDRVTGEISVAKKVFDVQGRDVVVVDDIISTGGTMVAATKLLREQKARKIMVMCTHPLLIGGAKEKIIRAGADSIVGTDCVPSDVSIVSIAPVIAEYLRKGSRGA